MNVTEISNQSTGYCPDLDSWHAVTAALRRAGLRHPSGFTQPIILRGYTNCFAINIVREDDVACGVRWARAGRSRSYRPTTGP